MTLRVNTKTYSEIASRRDRISLYKLTCSQVLGRRREIRVHHRFVAFMRSPRCAPSG